MTGFRPCKCLTILYFEGRDCSRGVFCAQFVVNVRICRLADTLVMRPTHESARPRPAYRFYSRFIAENVFELNSKRRPPA